MSNQLTPASWIKSCLAAVSLAAGVVGSARACDDADAQPPFRPMPVRPVPVRPVPVRPVPPPVMRPVPPPVIRPVPPPFVRYPFWPPTVVKPPVVVIRPPTVSPTVIVPSPAADTGMVITQLAYGPALDAGLQQGDIIIRIDGARTQSFADLRALLVASKGISRFLVYRPSTGKIENRDVRVVGSLIGATVVETPIELAEPAETPQPNGKT